MYCIYALDLDIYIYNITMKNLRNKQIFIYTYHLIIVIYNEIV